MYELIYGNLLSKNQFRYQIPILCNRSNFSVYNYFYIKIFQHDKKFNEQDYRGNKIKRDVIIKTPDSSYLKMCFTIILLSKFNEKLMRISFFN